MPVLEYFGHQGSFEKMFYNRFNHGKGHKTGNQKTFTSNIVFNEVLMKLKEYLMVGLCLFYKILCNKAISEKWITIL